MGNRQKSILLLDDSFINERFLKRLNGQLKKGQVGFIYLDIKRFGDVYQTRGQLFCNRVLQTLNQIILRFEQEKWEGCFSRRMLGDDLFLFFLLPDQKVDLFSDFAYRLRTEVEQQLNAELNLPEKELELYVGTSIFHSVSSKNISNELYRGLKQAMQDAKNEAQLEQIERRKEFFRILEQKLIRAVYQPIISLLTGAVYGYEALARGPQGSGFEAPLDMFSYAEQMDSLYHLEKVAREQAISGFRCGETNSKLFINLNANVINDPFFTAGETAKLLRRVNLTPQQIVFEITERQSIEDFPSFVKAINYYRKQGYRIAIDDAGAGYSSLQAIAEIRPDYIKIDRSIIHQIDSHHAKRILLETLVTFATKMNCKIIAEGIETTQELNTVLKIGVHCGQGYLLGRPKAGFEEVSAEIVKLIKRNQYVPTTQGYSGALKDIVRPVKTFEEGTVTQEIVSYFNRFEDESGVVIVREGRPIGLIMREKLFQALASQYGVPLYWKRPVSKLMDGNPIILDENTGVEDASRIAMVRDHQRIYDLLIVTREGNILGVVTIHSILDTITNAKLEYARDMNPLTGLPGNRLIEIELDKRIQLGQDFSVIYADLDRFKEFNDRCGFREGDQVIRGLANLLLSVLSNASVKDDFLGHIGGDDFIIITNHPSPQEICRQIIERFDNEQSGHGPTISLALLRCSGNDLKGFSAEQLSNQAVQIKKIAKSQAGSAFVEREMS